MQMLQFLGLLPRGMCVWGLTLFCIYILTTKSFSIIQLSLKSQESLLKILFFFSETKTAAYKHLGTGF
jgi:hypothetical protein